MIQPVTIRDQKAAGTKKLFFTIYPKRCNVTQFIYIRKLLYMFWVELPAETCRAVSGYK
jgi:hypothetical protein